MSIHLPPPLKKLASRFLDHLNSSCAGPNVILNQTRPHKPIAVTAHYSNKICMDQVHVRIGSGEFEARDRGWTTRLRDIPDAMKAARWRNMVLEHSSLPYVLHLAKNSSEVKVRPPKPPKGLRPSPHRPFFRLRRSVMIFPTTLNLGNNTSGAQFSRYRVSVNTSPPSTVVLLALCTSHLSR